MPAQLVRLDTAAPASSPADQQVSHSGWSPTSHRVYPDPSSIPPHWQIYPAYQLRDSRQPIPPGTVLQGIAQPPWSRPYAANARFMQLQPFVAPPAPPIPHKVWILKCKTCGTFLTNRGMKAVLLLRPNVPLYSTDALPINCSAFSPPSEAPLPAPSLSVSSHGPASSGASYSRSARSSVSGPGGNGDGPQQGGTSLEHPPSRTCECLTQTLCCHGCGNPVGYMIVSPCQRCTSSITANNRSTNGHRFVFYSSEITASERHYVPGEPGVTAFHPPPPASSSAQTAQSGLTNISVGTGTPPRQAVGHQPGSPSGSTMSTPSFMPSLVSSPVVAAAPSAGRRTSVDYLPATAADVPSAVPASPLSPGQLSPSALAARSRTASSTVQVQTNPVRQSEEAVPAVPPVPPNSHSTSPHPGSTPMFSDAPVPPAPPVPALPSSRARAASTSAATASSAVSTSTSLTFAHPLSLQPYAGPARTSPQQLSPLLPPEPLKAGEVLYWHHLLRSGEIPAVEENARAQLDVEAQAKIRREEARMVGERKNSGRVPLTGVIAGR
ncbi:hypothetical protein BD414DRAFT_497182 [Trametes punicea]|nr:hypothetical protein BD414DRAFT_497182 [Trametes punicea]